MHYSTYPPKYGQHGDVAMQFVNIRPTLAGSARKDCGYRIEYVFNKKSE